MRLHYYIIPVISSSLTKITQIIGSSTFIYIPTFMYINCIINSCIYTETNFSRKTIKSSEQFDRQYKHLKALLDE